MDLTVKTLNPDNPRELEQYNDLLDLLTTRANDIEKQKQILHSINQSEHILLLVAEDRDAEKICGTVMGVSFYDPCDECREVVVVENVATHPDYRRCGVARSLFAALEDWARARNVHYIILCSGLTRTEAHTAYAALGYDEVRGFKKYL